MQWVRWSALVLWYVGMFKTLIRLGMMTPDVELLPAGSQGCDDPQFAECVFSSDRPITHRR